MKSFFPPKNHILPEGVAFLRPRAYAPIACASIADRPTHEEAAKALKNGKIVVWPMEAMPFGILKSLAQDYEDKIIPFAPLLAAPRFLHLERAVRSGVLGEIATVTHYRTSGFQELEYDALSLTLNDIAFIRRMFGRAAQVFATRAQASQNSLQTRGTDFLTACLALDNGMIANIICHVSSSLTDRFAFDYSGRKGNLVHSGDEGFTIAEDRKPSLDESSGTEAALKELLLCIQDKSKPFYSVGEWLDDLDTIRAIRESAEAFSPRTLEPRALEFHGTDPGFSAAQGVR